MLSGRREEPLIGVVVELQFGEQQPDVGLDLRLAERRDRDGHLHDLLQVIASERFSCLGAGRVAVVDRGLNEALVGADDVGRLLDVQEEAYGLEGVNDRVGEAAIDVVDEHNDGADVLAEVLHQLREVAAEACDVVIPPVRRVRGCRRCGEALRRLTGNRRQGWIRAGQQSAAGGCSACNAHLPYALSESREAVAYALS